MNIIEDIERRVKGNRQLCREAFVYFLCTNSIETFGIVHSQTP